MLGVVLHEYQRAVSDVDGCLTTATRICQATDARKAADLEALRVRAVEALTAIGDLLRPERKDS